MNYSLPILDVWKARSFWAQLLLLLTVCLNAIGIDLMGLFQAMGLGDSPEQVIDGGISLWQTLAPIIFGFWAWWERRSPNYRLVWPWQSSAVLLLGLCLLTGTQAGAEVAVTAPSPSEMEAPSGGTAVAIMIAVVLAAACFVVASRTGPKNH